MNLLRGALLIGAGLSLCAPALAQSTPSTEAPATSASAAPAAGGAMAPAAGAPDAGAMTGGAVPGANIGPGWAAFSQIASTYTDSSLVVDTHEDINGKVFDAAIRLQYKKPNLARCLVLNGANKNAEIVWRGGAKVQAHEGGQYNAIVVVLDRNNPRVTDAVGFGCGQTSLDQTRDFFLAHGTVTESAGPTIGGVATTAETLTPSDPATNFKMTKQVMYLSTATHLPVENLGYVGDKVVLDAKFSQVQLNPGLTAKTFTLTS